MLKSKVPLSWVKRVLEVDGKDARVLDLDPDKPLTDQVDGAVDELGNVEWNNVQRVSSTSTLGDSSDGDIEEEAKERSLSSIMGRGSGSSSAGEIPADTFASVKAELAAMSARAEGALANSLNKAPFDEGSSSPDSSQDGNDVGLSPGSTTTSPGAGSTDITSAAVAASNARMNRLRAIRAKNGRGSGSSTSSLNNANDRDMGRQRRSVDEIRGRRNALPPKMPEAAPVQRKTYPPGGTGAAGLQPSPSNAQRGSGSGGGSVSSSGKKKSRVDLPLKDDPRFSKYFQMIRSRVPRSWVERVIEVDDRDPAMLDLDPNQSLASQIGEEEAVGKGDSATVNSTTYDDESRASSRRESSGASSTADKSEQSPQPKEDKQTGNEVLEALRLPITQIGEDVNNDDERSEASSITANYTLEGDQNRSTKGSVSNIDLTKISAFLDSIDAKMKESSEEEVAEHALPRFTTQEEVEDKLMEMRRRSALPARQPMP